MVGGLILALFASTDHVTQSMHVAQGVTALSPALRLAAEAIADCGKEY